MGIRKYVEMNSENATDHNVQKAAKAVLRGKYIALNGYILFKRGH